MAEAVLGGFGASSAIVQILSSLIVSTRELRKALKTAKAAPKEIKYFYNEASVFTLLIDTFHGLAKDAPKPEGGKALRKRKRLLNGIEQQCTDVKEGVEELVIKFNRTYRGTGDTRAMTVWARVKWVVRRPDLDELRLLMNDTKMSLTALSVMLKWEDAKRGDDKENMYVWTLFEFGGAIY